MTAHSAIPYCGPGPSPEQLWLRWNGDPLLMLCLCAGLIMAFRLDGLPRRAAFGAVTVGAFLYLSPLCAFGSALFTARTVHHLSILFIAAPLLAQACNRIRLLGSLACWTIVQALILWAWHWPGAYAQALSNDAAFWLMQLTIIGSAAAFWHALWRSNLAARVIAVAATMMQMSLLGALITFAGRPLYSPHWLTTQAWGMTPLADQQLAGLLMWIPGGSLYLIAALYYSWRLLRTDHVPVAMMR